MAKQVKRNKGNTANGKASPKSAVKAGAAPAITKSAGSNSNKQDVGVKPKARSWLFWLPIQLVVIAISIQIAYTIRLYAIEEYGLVIHEFDPWFNYRATEYLKAHGLKAFFEWYDYMSWYPLGRPVGSTIYPGMQITAVWIQENFLPKILGIAMSLNDVCCYIPAWFGVIATLFTGLLASECSNSKTVGALAALVMSCIPAHIMRSVGGGYDNESIAMTAMTATFYFWVRSLRNEVSSIPFGIISGFAYFYMVAAWGGYVFVLNMVGIHCIFLVFLNGLRHDATLHKSYSLFYTIGTLGAIQIPVVGLTPLKSLEQLGPLGVFGILQILFVIDLIKRARGLTSPGDIRKLYLQMFSLSGILAAGLCVALYPTGYFGPLSSRVRGLFVTHTRTGNPLVDSVAEHQPASSNAYYQFLHTMCYFAPFGLAIMLFDVVSNKANRNARWFAILYSIVAYFFSSKMVRLIILLGPCTSICAGVAISFMLEWIVDEAYVMILGGEDSTGDDDVSKPNNKKKAPIQKKHKNSILGPEFAKIVEQSSVAYKKNIMVRRSGALFLGLVLFLKALEFYGYCQNMARAMSNPSIMFMAQTRDGQKVLVDDYREAYFWLRDKTPEDSRVMAWWDYGYQITGIGNRTTIADGNTWNHEHIATLGRCLVSPEKKAHDMIKHLADYVLVWTGGGGDDLAKMPHIARIANSIYSDVCNGDPLCSQLGYIDQRGTPSPFMANSLLYKLHSGFQRQGVELSNKRFTNVFNSKYNKVRIWKVENVDQKSRKWNKNPKNRVCDPPGSWICKGQYPPAFQKFVNEGKNFAQLEDFNVKKDKEAQEYQRRYHEQMSKRGK